MIRAYHRPKSITEALVLLDRKDPRTIPLAGGSAVSKLTEEVDVVDLQDLGLDKLEVGSDLVSVGAMTRVAQLESLAFGPWLALEGPRNLQNTATLGGVLVRSDGRSMITTALLAYDAKLFWAPGNLEINLGDWLPQRKSWKAGKIITEIKWGSKPELRIETIGRSPLDTPLLIVAMTKWSSGRTRIVVGGFGVMPTLAMDGPSANGAEEAAKAACLTSTDAWASAEYRSEVAGILARRLVS